jgi:hypothetical protein
MAFNPTIDAANALVDIDIAREYLGVKQSDERRLPTIVQCVNGASWYCNSYTKRKLLSRALTEYYNGKGISTIMLNNYPCTTLTSVYDDLDRAYGADTLVSASYLVVMPTDLLYSVIYDNGTFLDGLKNVKITYTAGYASGSVPYDLQQACLGLVGLYFHHTDEKMLNVQSRTVGDGSVTVNTNSVPQWITDILNIYKRKW